MSSAINLLLVEERTILIYCKELTFFAIKLDETFFGCLHLSVYPEVLSFLVDE